MNLGKLERLELRIVWKGEASSFTPWLAREENIAILSDEIGIELEVQSFEERVGPFRADILCKDTSSEHFVLIENQLEKTDHLHLGQLLTYAAGLNAVTIIWISAKFTEEHRAALDWLNNITNEQVEFFGIEIELYRIGSSEPAPKFNIVSKPNDWSKTIRRNAEGTEFTETKLLQREYWQALKDFVENKKSFLKLQKPLPQHWYNVRIGRSNFVMSAFVNSFQGTIGVTLHLSGPAAKGNYYKLKESSFNESMDVLGKNIEWMELPQGKESKIRLTYSTDYQNKEEWNQQHQWLINTLEKFYNFFALKIKVL